MSNFDNFTHVIAGHDEPQYVPFTVTDGGPSYGEIAVLRKGSHDGKYLSRVSGACSHRFPAATTYPWVTNLAS